MRFTRSLLLALILLPGASASRAQEPRDPALPHVREILTRPAIPNDREPTTLILLGETPYPCAEVFGARVIDPHQVFLGFRHSFPCSDTIRRPWRQSFDLGVLPAGIHRVGIRLAVVRQAGHGDTAYYNGRFEFAVVRDSVPPPPPPGRLPYVDEIRILPKPNMLPVERPICPTDSILVLVRGHFPHGCFRLRRIDVQELAAPEPIPPIVRILVDDRECDGPCTRALVPWSGSVLVRPIPAGRHELRVELWQASCSDTVPLDRRYATRVPFAVDSCGPQPRPTCVIGTWVRPGRPGECDATISPGRPAQVVFGVHSTVALSALEGEFLVQPPALRIARLEAVGPAAGMRLSWARTPAGARFVLFAERGAPIPPSPFLGGHEPVPVLRLTLEQSAALVAPAETFVSSRALFGSDAEARGVPECPIPREVRIASHFFRARICSERACDLNGDGRVDVRDLVLMMLCLRHERPCPDSTGARLDCDRDSAFTLDDVLCCARRILDRRPCPDCPRDSTGRREPAVGVSLGPPAGDGPDLPLRLRGADRLGAARLALRYPADRYDVAGVELRDGDADEWLHLYEARDGEIVIGLIRMADHAPEPGGDGALDLVLRLGLKPGARPGGEVTATDGEFSGPDGARLEVDLGRPARALGGPARVALSGSRPNPSSGVTRFSVTLDRPDAVDVAVYDVTGRRVATVYRGPLGAGTREFEWDGRLAGGAAAASGIYFYRAASSGEAASRKLILVREN